MQLLILLAFSGSIYSFIVIIFLDNLTSLLLQFDTLFIIP